MLELVLGVAFSVHLNLKGDYNEVHPYLQVSYQQMSLGAYLNSENNISPYLSYNKNYGKVWINLGAVGNYSLASVLPYTRVGYELSENLNIFLTPAYENYNNQERFGSVVGLSLEFKF